MARRFCKCAPIPLFTVAGDVKEEWAIYRDALEKSGYFNSSVWLDGVQIMDEGKIVLPELQALMPKL